MGILRLGMVGWDAEDFNCDDWLCRLLSGCARIGLVPVTEGQTIDLIPRDFSAELALRLIRAPRPASDPPKVQRRNFRKLRPLPAQLLLCFPWAFSIPPAVAMARQAKCTVIVVASPRLAAR